VLLELPLPFTPELEEEFPPVADAPEVELDPEVAVAPEVEVLLLVVVLVGGVLGGGVTLTTSHS
jgi:hypothetical protein